MKVIAVDDEQAALNNLVHTLHEFKEFAEIAAFTSPHKALAWLGENKADIAFLDISMSGMDGLTLAKELKELCPHCGVIFVTGFSHYALEALQLHANGYLLKPVKSESIRRELDYMKNCLPLVIGEGRQIRVQCFGNFEVFADNEPVRFRYVKTKELLAYLVDRKGAYCSNGEIMGILWENKAVTPGLASQLRNLLADLVATFKAYGNGDVIRKQRGMTAIVPDKVECDYYDWSRGDIRAVNSYGGEYMSQYSWGEFTLGSLEAVRKNC